MPSPRFVDANVFLRYFTNDDPQKGQRAKQLLERVEQGQEKIATSLLVVFETIFTLERTYKAAKADVRDIIHDVLSLPGLLLPRRSGGRDSATNHPRGHAHTLNL